MTTELTGMLPRIPYDYASTIINRALLETYRKNIWSFLFFEGNWTSPSAWITSGTVSVVQGRSTIQFDPLTATPAINAIGLVPSPVTQRQFRVGVGTVYNIWAYSAPSGTVDTSGTAVTWDSGDDFSAGVGGAWNGLSYAISGVVYTIASVSSATALVLTTSAGAQSGATFQMGGIATLDRNYQEATAATSGYAILQCYYVSPVSDLKGWDAVVDMLNYNPLYLNKDRPWINQIDPQRTFYYIPTHVVPYQVDQNPNSSTYGYQMFEMWGWPTYQLTWQLYGYRKGTPLVNPDDEIPIQIGEDCVMAKARYYGYEWAEANRENARTGGNLLQLKRDAQIEHELLVRQYRRDDRNLVDAWYTKFRRSRSLPNREPSYNAIAGVASPGV